ncbi:MAG TPA: hypothetical protein PKA76_19780 [Pirellulaceae bacterium]|nr:hypothetical protein [Pirellulaceae bacterium]
MLTWEELENGKKGQLPLPGFTIWPTIAERAFVVLARNWHDEVSKTTKDHGLSRSCDLKAYSCLHLAADWGGEFSEVAQRQASANILLAEAQSSNPWLNRLPWQLCDSFTANRPNSYAHRVFLANLDHHNSSCRTLMIEMCWFIIEKIDMTEARRRLLKNFGDTLMWPLEAAGVAAKSFADADQFFEYAETNAPIDLFHERLRALNSEQYYSRLEKLKDTGITTAQASLWRTEIECRTLIEKSCLGLKGRISETGTGPVYRV